MGQFPRFVKLIVISLLLPAFLAGCRFESGRTPTTPAATTPAPICSNNDANLIASNVRSGVSILGVMGTYFGPYAESNFASNMRRAKGFAQMTWVEDAAMTSAYGVSSAGYSAIPRFALDHDNRFDNFLAASVDPVDRTGWAARTCGTTGILSARIDDCDDEFGADATWDGNAKGSSGESVWKLVSRTGDITSAPQRGREVWQDQRTKLLWSSRVDTNGMNWCKAGGRNSITGNPAAEADPNNYCNSNPAQNTSGLAISACFEDGGTNFTTTDNLASEIDNLGKAGLGLSSTPAVHWRLPNRNDYFQAEVDGIRFVLPDTLTLGNLEWTSTLASAATGQAYAFDAGKGIMMKDWRNNGFSTRCVGR